VVNFGEGLGLTENTEFLGKAIAEQELMLKDISRDDYICGYDGSSKKIDF
jgi:hypothetical protein